MALSQVMPELTDPSVVKRKSPLRFSVMEMLALGDDHIFDEYMQSARYFLSTPAFKRREPQVKWIHDFFSMTANNVDPERSYGGTMLVPKPDPFGRYPLVSFMPKPETLNPPSYEVDLVWAGATVPPLPGESPDPASGVYLGNGYTRVGEAARYEDDVGPYFRSHTPFGVASYGAGLGFVLYSAHALTAALLHGYKGVYSSSEGQRTEGDPATAAAWWERALSRGYAEAVRDVVSLNGDFQYGTGEVLDATRVLRTGLVVLLGQPKGSPAARRGLPVGSGQRSGFNASAARTYSHSIPQALTANDAYSEPIGNGLNQGMRAILMAEEAGIYNRDGRPTYLTHRKRVEASKQARIDYLSHSFHGPSPMLAMLILEMLAEVDPTATVDYASRPDIAPIFARNAAARQMIDRLRAGRQVAGMHGLNGLGEYECRSIGEAVDAAAAGQLQPDMTSDNPYRLPSVSVETRMMSARYKDL